jgi:hypothetical protein
MLLRNWLKSGVAGAAMDRGRRGGNNPSSGDPGASRPPPPPPAMSGVAGRPFAGEGALPPPCVATTRCGPRDASARSRSLPGPSSRTVSTDGQPPMLLLLLLLVWRWRGGTGPASAAAPTGDGPTRATEGGGTDEWRVRQSAWSAARVSVRVWGVTPGRLAGSGRPRSTERRVETAPRAAR